MIEMDARVTLVKLRHTIIYIHLQNKFANTNHNAFCYLVESLLDTFKVSGQELFLVEQSQVSCEVSVHLK